MQSSRLIVSVLAVGLFSALLGCSRTRYEYTVQPGEKDLEAVAAKVYGDAKHASLLAEANPEAAGGKLRPGQKLVVPPLKTKDGRAVRPKMCNRAEVYD